MLIAAHHDQTPDTIYGADNDGSGIAIMLQLAEIFASEGKLPYTLVFLSTDGEEYGMLGSRRYVQTHPDTEDIIAGISLDNLGKKWSNGMKVELIGQFRRYGSIWPVLAAQGAARAAGDLWVPQARSLIDQILDQAVPISFMDQGPMVAAGIPALGFATSYAPDASELVWETYHTQEDTVDTLSPAALHQSGRIAEALIRQLLSMETYPRERGPYLYLSGRNQVLRGVPLWAVFVGFAAVFFVGSYAVSGGLSIETLAAWRGALPHYLSLWLPLLASVLLLYAFVAVGLMDKYHLYPATAKGQQLFEPRWPAVAGYVVGLAVLLGVGRWLAGRYYLHATAPAYRATKGLALAAVGLAGVYVLLISPFSLLFFVPLLFWLLIGGRTGVARAIDIVLFLLGGLLVYVLFYFFGFLILRNDWAVLWYLQMMFSIRTISFPTATAITAIVGAGLSMVVPAPTESR
jgi:hypothetical protein